MAARSPDEWMRLRLPLAVAPGMHTGALLCRGPLPQSLFASCVEKEITCDVTLLSSASVREDKYLQKFVLHQA